MSTTIDSLSIQIETQAGKSVSKIEKLTKALESLRTKANISGVVGGLNRLTESLEKLNGESGKLSNLKKLTTSLKSVSVGTDGLSRSTVWLRNNLSGTSVDLAATIQNIRTYAEAVQWAIDVTKGAIAQAIQWDGVQARFGRAMAESAGEYYEYAKKIEDVMGINLQQFMGNSSLFADMMRGFGVDRADAATMSIGFTELAYDIWAGTNDVFKTLEEAMDAVRSTIGGETESIQRAGFSVIESTLQETAARHNLAVNIEKATMAEKTYLRYLTLVDQAHTRGYVGVYAAEMKTAEGAMRSMTQSLRTLAQAFGSLFIPILEIAIPYVTAFVEVVTDAVRWFAGLFGIELFEIDWSSTSKGVGDLASGAESAGVGLDKAAGAAKKLKDYTMGFDELNVINPDAGGAGEAGGAGGAGGASGNGDWFEGLDLSTLWDESVFAKASQKVDELKAKMLDFLDEWKVRLAIIDAALATLGLTKLLSNFGEALGLSDNVLENLNKISKFAVGVITIVLQYSWQHELFKSFLETGSWKDYLAALIVGAIGTGVLYYTWGSAGLVIGLGITAIAAFDAVFENGGVTDLESLTTALTGVGTAVGAVSVVWYKFGDEISNVIRALKGVLTGSEAARSAFTMMHPTITKIATGFSGVVKAAGAFIGGLSGTTIAVVAAALTAVASAVYFVYENWEKVVKIVKDFFNENIAPKLENIKENFRTVKEAVVQLFDSFGGAGKKISEFFEGVDWSKLSWIGTLFETLGGIVFSVIGAQIATAFNVFVGIIENFTKIFSGAVQIWSGIIQLIVSLFTLDLSKAWESVKLIASGIADAIGGMVHLIFDIVEDFVMGVINWFTELWDELVGHSIVPDMCDAIVETFEDMIENVVSAVKDFMTDIISRFKQMWVDITTWWSSNVQPKFTKEYWLNKFDVLRSAIGEKLTAFKKTISDKWADIKSWWSSNVAPKLTLSFWLDKLKNLKEGFTQTIKNMVNAGIDLINRFINNLNDRMEFSWNGIEIAGEEIVPAGSVQLFTIPTIPRFERGGFIEDGLFTMNRGEIAGKFSNGKSVVANNEQIVEGISRGVYEAVVAAMGEKSGGGEQAVNVYLDGKQIYSSVKRTESRRGIPLMGNQLGYSY